MFVSVLQSPKTFQRKNLRPKASKKKHKQKLKKRTISKKTKAPDLCPNSQEMPKDTPPLLQEILRTIWRNQHNLLELQTTSEKKKSLHRKKKKKHNPISGTYSGVDLGGMWSNPNSERYSEADLDDVWSNPKLWKLLRNRYGWKLKQPQQQQLDCNRTNFWIATKSRWHANEQHPERIAGGREAEKHKWEKGGKFIVAESAISGKTHDSHPLFKI